MRKIRIPLLLAAVALPGASLLAQQAGRVVNSLSQSCGYRQWVDAFHPEKPVFPKPADKCPTDEKKPTFTREGTLACPTLNAYHEANNAMTHGWRYVPTAGVPHRNGMRVGDRVSAASFGCTIYHDGTPAPISAVTFAQAQTEVGWVYRNNLRN